MYYTIVTYIAVRYIYYVYITLYSIYYAKYILYIHLSGAQYGSAFKFYEKCDDGRSYEVSGQISLCGLFLEGTYLSRSGGGTLRCSRSPYPLKHLDGSQNDQYNWSAICLILKNCALLCSLACSKLCSGLIVGLDDISAPIAGLSEQKARSTEHALDDSLDEMMEADEGEEEGPLEVYNKSSSSPREDEERSERAEADTNEALCDTWINSNLLSGGLVHNPALLTSLAASLLQWIDSSKLISTGKRTKSDMDVAEEDTGSDSNLTYYGKAPAAIISPSFEYAELLLWWVYKVFPQVQPFVTELLQHPQPLIMSSYPGIDSGVGRVYVSSIDESPEDDSNARSTSLSATTVSKRFIDILLLNGDEANLLDNYILQHTGQLSIKRIGGEALADTRRYLLAAAIYHRYVPYPLILSPPLYNTNLTLSHSFSPLSFSTLYI